MTLTAERKTDRWVGSGFDFPPQYYAMGDDIIYKGGLVVLNSDGYAEAGSTAADHNQCVGVAIETVDNAGGSNGDKSVHAQAGVWHFGNSASSDEITVDDIGAVCYVVDDETVAKTSDSNARSAAGKVMGVDANGVWVLVGAHV